MNMKSFIQKVIHLCGKHYFLQPSAVSAGEFALYNYKYGPPGELLRNNIYQEWFLSNAINTEECMLPYGNLDDTVSTIEVIRDPFIHAKELLSEKLPFGICGSKIESLSSQNDSVLVSCERSSENSYFHPVKYTALRTYLFSNPSHSSQQFNRWQRQRKHWWRKFSGSPGRYTLTDVKSLSQGETVMIEAEFPWGSEILETICLRGSKLFEQLDNTSRAQFEVKDGRRIVVPHIIESVMTLDGAMLAFLCDAFEEHPSSPSRKSSSDISNSALLRPTLHLHRRLAPYKASFSASSSSSSSAEDLNDLALFLTRQLRRAGIPILLLPDITKKSLEAQHIRNDEMGIPYTVVMNETTLKNGIVGLRSRDTSLKEQLHITDLKSRMKLLLKNY